MASCYVRLFRRSELMCFPCDATVIGGCVFGSYDPSTEASTFIDLALPSTCVPCTWTLGLLDSIYSVAEQFGTDWISIWSLNALLIRPDQNQVVTFRHDYDCIESMQCSDENQSIAPPCFAGWDQYLLRPSV
jgi:hypothetical protein